MTKYIYTKNKDSFMGSENRIQLSEYDTVKKILIKHNALHLDIDQIDDSELMFDLYGHFQEQMPYGTQKARDGDPDEYIYDKLEDLGLPLGEQQL
tara:strand:+ start:42 stop:326 length:285 start_codon:yes stop_codon:yes gene_type:complete